MAYKSNVNSQIRGFYFAGSGNDTNSGETLEVPFATMQKAIDAAFSLNPIPQAGNIALVNVAQGGSFDVGFILQDWIQFAAEDVTIETSQAIAVEIASFLSLRIAGVTNSQNGGVTFMVDDKQAIGLEALFMAIGGTSAIGLKVTGVVDDLFITLSRVLIFGEGSTGIDITSTTTDPIDININTVSLSANNTTFINYNPVNAADSCVLNVSSINKGTSTGTEGFMVESGHLTAISGTIDVDTAIHVKNGAELDFSSLTVSGDIIVDSGGVLNAIIVSHDSGAITNNGTINGIINGKRFGTYLPQVVLIAESFVNQNPTGLDTPLQVEFGAAQGTVSDPVMIDAAGVMTINETGRYRASLFAQYGRTGAGSTSWLFFRGLLNGVQEQVSVLGKLDNANSDLPIQFEVTRTLEAGDVLVFQVIRDSQGNNSGGLLSESPTPAGWLDSPSAHITMIKE